MVDTKEKFFKWGEQYPTKEEREAVVKKMSKIEFDSFIKACPNIQGKIHFSKIWKEAHQNEN